MKAVAVVAAVVAGLLLSPVSAHGANPCDLILHRGFHNATHDEETVESVETASRWGFGGEIDARVTADGRVVAVHDDTLRRITGGVDTRRPEDMTLAELRAVELVNGGRIATVRQLVKAAKRTGGRLIIEGKRFPQHEQAWRSDGLADIVDAIVSTGMTSRVYVGGTFGFTKAIHVLAPQLRTFWRADNDEALTVANADARWATLVEASARRWTPGSVEAMSNAGIIPATRNADSESEWQPGWDAGIRTWQTNRPRALYSWCADQ